MAEIVQRRRSAELLDLALFKAEAAVEATEEAGCSCGCGGESKSSELIELSVLQPETVTLAMVGTAVATAIDPICGMTVEIATAKYTFTHEGTTCYFCCVGCLATFQRQRMGNE
jgi:YHS domain-containing protein